jgi:hypothetical protein
MGSTVYRGFYYILCVRLDLLWYVLFQLWSILRRQKKNMLGNKAAYNGVRRTADGAWLTVFLYSQQSINMYSPNKSKQLTH